jgi:RimJ/RimL family protein N-acetyltransferase
MPDHPGISGELTLLRPVEAADLAFLRDLFNDPRVSSMVVGTGAPVSSAEQERWFERVTAGQAGKRYFTVIERATGYPVGLVSLEDLDWVNRSARHSVKLHPDFGGRGLAYDAAMTRNAWAFFVLGLHRLEAVILDFNLASRRLYERLGYRLEGQAREAVFRDGRWCDLVRYGLLRHEAEADPAMSTYRRLVVPVDVAVDEGQDPVAR